MNNECGHNWRVFGHGFQEDTLLVRCPECYAVGQVADPSDEEQARLRDVSAGPYHWPHNDRVEVLQSGCRLRQAWCDDCGCPSVSLAEYLSPGGILKAEGSCPRCGYRFSILEHVHDGTGSFWENWPVKLPVQADDIERTFERLLCLAQKQIKEAKVRAIRRATGGPAPAADMMTGGLDRAADPKLDQPTFDPEFLAELDKLDNEQP